MKHSSAFTLVELSIVIAVIGLLVGGIFAGQSLLRAAELRSVVTQAGNFKTAIVAFEEKYRYLPGDMPTAYRFWGGDCGTDSTDPSTGCNGNGDGLISQYTDNGEFTKAWEHLSHAGLITGLYDGSGSIVGTAVQPTAQLVALTAANSPASKVKNSLWAAGTGTCEGCGVDYYGGLPYNVLTLGSPNALEPYRLQKLTDLSLQEAWNIDAKTDDGLAVSGNLRGYGGTLMGADLDSPADPYTMKARGAGTKNATILSFILPNNPGSGVVY